MWAPSRNARQRKLSHFGSYCHSLPTGMASTDNASIGGNGGRSASGISPYRKCGGRKPHPVLINWSETRVARIAPKRHIAAEPLFHLPIRIHISDHTQKIFPAVLARAHGQISRASHRGNAGNVSQRKRQARLLDYFREPGIYLGVPGHGTTRFCPNSHRVYSRRGLHRNQVAEVLPRVV